MIYDQELSAISFLITRLIYDLKELRKLMQEDKTGLNKDLMIDETFVLQGKLSMIDGYLSKRRQIERELDMTAQEKIGGKPFKMPGRERQKVGVKA